jgi:hypothetical protein
MTVKADNKRRIVVPDAKPGDVFSFENVSEGRFMLVRLTPPPLPRKKTKREVLAAIKASKLKFIPWEELREMTREP